MTTIDVTDATFQTEVLDRSQATPVVVDLWAPWCGPCKTLGPIIERVVDETDGAVVLAKINVDDNPQAAAAFRVQSIPAVYALKDGAVVDGFMGAQGEAQVREFVERLAPTPEQTEVERLIEAGDEASLQQALLLEPDNEAAIVGLAEIMVGDGRKDGALELLGRIPETAEARRVAALARTGASAGDDVTAKLDDLLERVKQDDDARKEFIDLLEVMGAEDPRTSVYRKRLTSRLF